MESENPYQSPASDPMPAAQPAGDQIQLAPLGDRFLGAFVDGLIGGGIALLIWGAMFWSGAVQSMESMGKPGSPQSALFGMVQFVAMMAVQWKFLTTTGQTIGKKVAKTRIARMDGSKPDMMDLVVKRYGFVTLLSLIPFAGRLLPLVDVLMIFRNDRRCLHDLVAGTQVLTMRSA